MNDARSVRRQYDRQSRVYDRLWSGYVRRTHDALAAYARVQPGERVLDVGCGTGAFLQRLAARHPEQPLTGLDLSPGMLAVARRRLAGYPHVELVEASAQALPFPDGRFDVVVSASVLHYWRDPVGGLAEAARVLRPGGRIALLDWSADFWWMRLMDRVLRVTDAAHARTLSSEALAAALRQSGFRDVEVVRRRLGIWGVMLAAARTASPSQPAHRPHHPSSP